MKWIRFLFFLFFLVGFHLFQSDQPIEWAWLACDNSLIIKSGSDSPLDKTLESDSKKTVSSLFVLIRFISQVKNPLSVSRFFQGTSPFWRPPPIEYSIHGYCALTHDEKGIS
jgi:hypothetical protein